MNRVRRTTAATATAVVLATAGGLLSVTAAPASAAVNCASPVFTRQFFANTTFSGTPRKTDCDNAIDQNWGTGAPASGLPKDNFGVRWSLTRDFGSGGPFALTASGLDGIRVYVDGVRKIDLWKNTSTTVSKTVNLTIPSGRHTLRVDYANWTGSARVKFAYTPRTSATVDKVKPLTPAGPAVTYDQTTSKAKLTWAKNKEMDLAGYRVYRRLKGTTFGSAPLATTTATSYTDATLPATGQTYYYEVRAYDKAGNTSTGTADLGVGTADRTAPAAPAGLDITDTSDEGGLRTGWTAVPDAVSYRVYRATSENGTYTVVGGTDEVSYRDASAQVGTTYYYRVSALDAAGNESARSNIAKGVRRDQTPPPAVTGLKATPTQYGFELTWDANPAPDLFRYTVHVGQLLRDEEDQVCSAHEEAWLSTSVTSYRYTTLPDGEERCFFVDAVDTAWNSHYQWTRSPNVVSATEVDTTPGVPTPEGSPLDVSAAPMESGEGNYVDWSGLADDAPEAAGGYRVYRWNPDTGAYEQIAETGSGVSRHSDTGARKGTTSYYWVKAVAADGTESVPAGDWVVNEP